MKLIDKEDLRFVDGMLVDPDGKVLGMPRLADEVNEIADLAELIKFVKTNTTKIEAAQTADKTVKFEPVREEKPKLQSKAAKPATPLVDADAEEKKAKAEEWLAVQHHADINSDLLRYSAIAAFIEKDYVLVDEFSGGVSKFQTNVLELTEDFVVDTITEYHDPAVRKLIAGVTITR